jgi:hypothetical protein
MEMKKNLILTFAIILFLSSNALVSAVTGSIANAKMVLYPEVNGWTNTVVEKTISVSNVNDVAINITLKADDNATKFVNIIDESFILQPGEEKKAQIEIKVRKEGRYEGRINVFFRPAEGQEGGVVLSSTIIVFAAKNRDYADNSTDTTDDNNNDNTNSTGTNTDKNNTLSGLPKLVKIWGLITLVLLVVLLLLLYIWSRKKRNQNKKRKRK